MVDGFALDLGVVAHRLGDEAVAGLLATLRHMMSHARNGRAVGRKAGVSTPAADTRGGHAGHGGARYPGELRVEPRGRTHHEGNDEAKEDFDPGETIGDLKNILKINLSGNQSREHSLAGRECPGEIMPRSGQEFPVAGIS